MLDGRDRLGPQDLVEVLKTYRDLLRLHQDRINRLNVYPVPDGDTGTNLALTMESVVKEVEANPRTDMAGLADALSHGSLMGARGNSGVILSQILRGIADGVRPLEAVDGATLTESLVRAREGAYKAVQNPVEGTILTVMSAAAAGATEAHAGGVATLAQVVQSATTNAADALERTPEMLPVLRAAGVVDSGGSGLLLLFYALLHVVTGAPLPEAPDEVVGGVPVARVAEVGMTGGRFEVMFLLEAPEEAMEGFRARWSAIGDSIAVVGGDGLYNCHVHTDDIGAAVEAAIEVGRPRSIRVTDLLEEVAEERWVRQAVGQHGGEAGTLAPGTAEPTNLEPATQPACAVVAVCSGSGIERIFRSLGVSGVVSGGRSMNPSLAEVLAAVEA
ncbi:MAG: DAK2 domain-containing protein, partial [Acidimicrobiales bacterium]